MPTTYTTNLKLAKPATGDLSGTWGTVVNDNITSMIEEAITGRAALSSWTSNAQTITTSNGTSSSGRCLMLDLSGTLTATGTLTVPSANKFFIVRNGTTGGYAVTVTMGSGTTVSVPNGETVMVYVDGTNIEAAPTTVSKADTATTASTVTTNANLTGVVTSVGNATAIADAALSIAKTSGLQAALDAKASKLSWTIKTTTYTAVAGDSLMANTTSAAFTITLPATPSANDVVRIADYAGTFATNNLTIGRNSSKIMSLSEDMTVSTNNVSLTLTYIDSTRGWALT